MQMAQLGGVAPSAARHTGRAPRVPMGSQAWRGKVHKNHITYNQHTNPDAAAHRGLRRLECRPV